MSRRWIGKPAKRQDYALQVREAISWFLPRRGLPTLAANSKLRWTARLLATCAILTVWSVEPTLGARFDGALAQLTAMFPSRRRAGGTYQGFIAALTKASQSLLDVIVPHLRAAAQQTAGASWEILGWIVFAVDGSKVDVPMTAANERALGVASRKKAGPQMLLTVMFHVGSGLIWGWRRSVAKASERSHLLEMLTLLPARAMLLADAGFTGYEVLKQIMDGGHSFVLRVGSNVHVLKKLYDVKQFDGLVWLWPKDQREANQPPLMLRLITINAGRNRTMHLLTSVLDDRRLSDADAARLYAMRWGIELLYRSLKQVMGRRKMLSGSPQNAQVELDWSVVGLWILGLMNAQACGDLRRLSPAQTLRAVRAAMGGRGKRRLRDTLARAMRDPYRRARSKMARHWPHKKREKPPGSPKARTALEEEVEAAKHFACPLAAA